MRHPAQAVELDVVLGGQAAEQALAFAPQRLHLHEAGIETLHRGARPGQQFAHHGIAFPVEFGGAALLDFPQPMVQGIHQQMTPLRVVQQVVLQVGIALNHPYITQHLVQHAGRAPGAPFVTQCLQRGPCLATQQADHDLAIGKRGVVIGDLAYALMRRARKAGKQEMVGAGRGVHGYFN